MIFLSRESPTYSSAYTPPIRTLFVFFNIFVFILFVVVVVFVFTNQIKIVMYTSDPISNTLVVAAPMFVDEKASALES